MATLATSAQKSSRPALESWPAVLPVVLPLVLYLLLIGLLWRPYQYIMYKDEINFIAIAERYARGDWATAPNAFWPPLLSWLQAILIGLGFGGPAAAKLLSILTGIPAYMALQGLLRAFAIKQPLRLWVSLFVTPALVYFALSASGPDLLLAALLGLYLRIILRPLRDLTRQEAMACGLLGALAYFCKGYALYFFLGHFGLLAFRDYLNTASSGERRVIRRNALAALAVLALLLAPWVSLLRAKYGITTLGVIGAYNQAMRSPDSPDMPPATYVGFVSPPPETTVSVWEEPIYLYRMLQPWSPFDSVRAFRHQLRLVEDNTRVMLTALQEFTIFWLAIAGAAFLLWAGPVRHSRHAALGSALLMVAVYPLGYLLIHMEARYLWPVYLPLVALAALALQYLARSGWLRPIATRVVLAAVLCSFLILPMQELRRRSHLGRSIDQFRELVAREGRLQGARIASNGDYGASVLLAYRLRAKYYGQPRPNATPAEIEQELQRLGVQYYLAWDGVRVDSSQLQFWKQFTVNSRVLSIYSVRNNS
jgi:hypothetical protein